MYRYRDSVENLFDGGSLRYGRIFPLSSLNWFLWQSQDLFGKESVITQLFTNVCYKVYYLLIIYTFYNT